MSIGPCNFVCGSGWLAFDILSPIAFTWIGTPFIPLAEYARAKIGASVNRGRPLIIGNGLGAAGRKEPNFGDRPAAFINKVWNLR
jgi:hypothetical protein